MRGVYHESGASRSLFVKVKQFESQVVGLKIGG